MPGQEGISNAKLNWLRAAVLGANDGVVSVSSIIVGVAGATNNRGTIFTAGLAGLVAGAMSMAVGEYVSVSSQSDTEKAYIKAEKKRLAANPEEEFDELVDMYTTKGMSAKTAHLVATELTEHDVIKAHLEVEFGIDENDLNNPSQAALASMLSFTIGALVPLLAVLSTSGHISRLVVTAVAVLIALCITGYASATVGGASRRRAIIRVVLGGALAMVITYAIGRAFGTVIQ
ncbi:MAG: putative rane protein [Candidatus Saccharibacteria bacterium]|nr:putative rane protein [Candidatus Saccharibacteria bacterium]